MTERHTGFTGTREGLTTRQSVALRALLGTLTGTLHHGDCLGADSEAHRLARVLGLSVHIHPPRSSTYRAFEAGNLVHAPLPYLARNHAIVHATSALIAAPRTGQEESRSGTWATVRYARRLGRPIAIITPDGELRIEGAWPSPR